MSTAPLPTPSTRQVFLSVFIVAQLFFLISANGIGFFKDVRTDMNASQRQAVAALAPGLPEEQGHVWTLLDHLGKTDKMWAELTGQPQNWSLFAPTIGRECIFPALELSWQHNPGDAPADKQVVLSENEPTDLEHYFRLGRFRLRRYETNIALTLRPFAEETRDQTNERWRDAIRAHVTDYADIIQGYLRWRLRQIMLRWPERKDPEQVTLVMRRYHINDYDDAPPYWSGPFVVPLALWRPRMEKDTLEWFDPVDDCFKNLSK